jgi:iron complex transport system ATP-binding protein
MSSTPNQCSAIRVENASVNLGTITAVDQVSLEILRGKWTSIIGPNGAGKSTLLRVLAGLIQGSYKTVVFEHDMNSLSSKSRARLISWLGQSEVINGDMSVYDLVMLGRLPYQSWIGGPSQDDHLAVLNALKQVQAEAWAERSVEELSGGERQRVLIARALAVVAQILMMDEPLNNLDPPHQADCLNLIRELVNSNKTVITVLHEISFALHSDDIVIMNKGKVINQSSSQDSDLHRDIEKVFDHRIKIYPLMDDFVVLFK